MSSFLDAAGFALPLYGDWLDTRHLIQNVTQMMGKTKLALLPKQPEWGQVTLPLTVEGVTTGYLPLGEGAGGGGGCGEVAGVGDSGAVSGLPARGFEVRLDMAHGEVTAESSDGRSYFFELTDGMSVADVYQQWGQLLEAMGADCRIGPRQQEMATTFLFTEDTTARRWDPDAAARGMELFRFAYGEILRFVSPFRGKKYEPKFFWGTFDVTAILYSGRAEPFPWDGVIEKSAFDECSVEFGFWPGDQRYERPAFFVLPYPFVDADLNAERNDAVGGSWIKELSEFVYPLDELFAHDDPQAVLQAFFAETFALTQRHNDWQNLDWFLQPLL
ncbi:MAG: DUF5996 family protein [Actinomycetes bacterium]|jgi:hypothetical protein|nr:DUF5996 family protein [Actinomycetes bacterium]